MHVCTVTTLAACTAFFCSKRYFDVINFDVIKLIYVPSATVVVTYRDHQVWSLRFKQDFRADKVSDP